MDDSTSSEGECDEEGELDEIEEMGQKDIVQEIENRENTANKTQLTELLQSALGEDPSKSKALNVEIHEALVRKWKYFTLNGLTKDDRETLLEKYQIPECFSAPNLNEQLRPKLNEKTIKRDEYRYETQKLISTALTAVSAAINLFNETEEGIDPEEVLERLMDTTKALADSQFQLSEARRAFINPRFAKPYQEILKQAKPDKNVFGGDLATKIKDLKDADKLFKDVEVEPTQKNQTNNKNMGNFRRPRPLGNKGQYNTTGGTSFREQSRPRLFFRRPFQNQGRFQDQSQGRFQNQNQTNYKKMQYKNN